MPGLLEEHKYSHSGWLAPDPQISGEEKAHKHKQIFPVTARWGGGSPDRVARDLPTGGQGSKVYVLCAEPKEHKHFRPGTRPGGSVTGVTEKLFMCQMFMCLFRLLKSGVEKLTRSVLKGFFNGALFSTVCILGALQRRVDLQGVFVKIGDFIKFKGFLVEFLENKNPQKTARKVDFSGPRLLQCT